MSAENTEYVRRTCVYAKGRPLPSAGKPPTECHGPVSWRIRWSKGTHYYCEAHGSWHAAVSPFAGYERVRNDGPGAQS